MYCVKVFFKVSLCRYIFIATILKECVGSATSLRGAVGELGVKAWHARAVRGHTVSAPHISEVCHSTPEGTPLRAGAHSSMVAGCRLTLAFASLASSLQVVPSEEQPNSAAHAVAMPKVFCSVEQYCGNLRVANRMSLRGQCFWQ